MVPRGSADSYAMKETRFRTVLGGVLVTGLTDNVRRSVGSSLGGSLWGTRGKAFSPLTSYLATLYLKNQSLIKMEGSVTNDG